MFRLMVVLMVVLSTVGLAPAQPLAERVPQDAVLYLGWRGSEELGPAYEASHLKSLLESTRLREVFTQFLPQLSQKLGEEDDEAAQALASLTRVASIMFRKSSAYVFNGIDEQWMPRFVLFSQAGEDAQELHEALQELLELAEDAPLPMQAFISGEFAGLTIGYEDVEEALPGGEGAAPGSALSASEGFQTTIERMQADPVVVLYVDAQRVLELIDRAVQANADEPSAQQWAKAREASGLAGLRRLVHTAAFEGKDWVSYTLIDAPAPRRGIVAMLDAAPLGDELLRAIPASATFAAAGGFDAAKLIARVREVVSAVDPQAHKEMDKALGAASMAIGRNVEKEILEPLGEHWLAYTSPKIGGNSWVGLILVNQLDDAKKAEQGINALWIFGQNLVASQLKDEEFVVRGLRTRINDLAVNYVGIPLVAPSWAIRDGRLYAGLFPQTVASAVEMAAADKSILDNEGFLKIRQRLAPDKKLTGFTYLDLEETAPELYQSWLAIVRLGLGFADLFGVQAPEPVLPPLHVLLAHLGPAGAVSWVDDAGWHRKSITPFPGAALMSSQQLTTVGGTAMGVSILLPSLNRARETANRVKCATNMRQIGLAMHMHASDHDGNFPPDLGNLVLAQKLSPDAFVCPSGSNSVPQFIRNAPPEQQAEWVNENADYVYRGAGKRSDTPADEAVLHEHLHHHDDGMNILFGDGHVEFVAEWMLGEHLPLEEGEQDMGKL